MQFIKSFNSIGKQDVIITGGKGASLGEMTKAGIPVPEGFVILSNAFESFIEETDLNVEIDSILHSVKHEEIHTVENASEKIKALILNAEMPKEIASEIKKAFKKLNVKYVAVRSSATSEDSASAAWAGQLESYLNTTEKNLLENVKKCWASLFTPRAIFYRFEKNLHKEKISVAVVIQKMIDSENSGVAFSVHPVTQDKNQLIIEAGFGLGEAIVSGQITPDSYVVEKEPRRIIDKNIQIQSKGLFKNKKGGNEWKELGEKGKKQVLTDKEILELAQLILKIEKHYGFPVDIEWAFEKGKFYIVQSRAITTLNEIKTKTPYFYYISRDFSFPMLELWYYTEAEVPIPYINKKQPCQPYLILERTDGTIKSYYDEAGQNWVKNIILEVAQRDKKFLITIEKELTKRLSSIQNIYENPRALNRKDFLKFIRDFEKAVPWAVIMWWLCGMEEKDLKEININKIKNLREKTDKLSAGTDVTIRRSLEKLYPKLGEYSAMLTIEEIKNNSLHSLEQLKKRDKGFIFTAGKLYIGTSRNEIEELFNIQLPEEKVDYHEEFKGTIAYKGKLRGIIRRVMGHKDLDKINEGEILVSPMTMPDFIGAMKKASAIITDEGGLTCHAAIIAREMKKPCIVGTKIATKILKDGMLVEVNADKGRVKILNKIDKKIVSFKEDINIGEWEFEFQQRNEHPILMADFWCRALYRKFVQEINLPVEPYDYLFTASSKGYVKTAQKKITLEAIKKAFNRENTYSVYLYNQTIKRVKELEVTVKYILREINSKTSNKKLIELWKKFDEAFLTFIPWYWIPYYPVEQNLLSDKVKQYLIKYKDKIEKITDFNNAFLISMSPTKEMVFKEEQKDFFDIVKIAIKKDNFSKDQIFNEKAKAYLKKYSWMNTFVFLPIEPLSLNEFVEKIEKAIKEKSIETYYLQEQKKAENNEISEKISQIIGKDKKLLLAIEDIQKIGWVLTWSVETSLHSLENLQPFFKLIAKRLGVPYSHWIHLTFDEIVQILQRKKNLEEMELKEREKGYFFMMEKGIQKMVIGAEGKSLSEWVEKNLNKIDNNITELKGQSACPGHVKGSVRIAVIAKESYKIKDGEILVCAMTSPDYIPAMKRALAIITDEGGLLSHAAIISREFGKPCIIGTKIATRVLKDGDIVEVNANKGVIKRLESF